MVVVLDTNVTDELEAEGRARDLIRHVQQARKDHDLNVTDRIRVRVEWAVDDLDSIRDHEDTIKAAVLADEIAWETGEDAPAISIAVV